MLDFPNAPVNGQLYQDGTSVWRWDAQKWVAGGGGGGSGTLMEVSAGTGIAVSPSPITITGSVELATMPALTLKGNAAGAPAVPADLTGAAVLPLLGGPFLPMTGGQLSGGIAVVENVNGSAALRGGNAQATGFSKSYQALFFDGTYTGNGIGPYAAFSVRDTASCLTQGAALVGLRVDHSMQPGLGTGNRAAIQAILVQNAGAPGANDTLKFYHGVIGQAYFNANEGGTASSPKGNAYGAAAIAQLQAGATFYSSAQGMEVNIAVQAGASVKHKSALTLISVNSDAVKGSTTDAMLVLARDGTTSVGFSYAIAFGRNATFGPTDGAGTLIGVPATAVVDTLHGVDLRTVNFAPNGYTFASPGFFVDRIGTVTLSGSSAGLNLLSGKLQFGNVQFAFRQVDYNVVYDVTGTVAALMLGATANALRNDLILFQDRAGGVNTLMLDATGLTIAGASAIKPGGGSWTAPSDVRLKTAIAPYTTGLAAVTQLQPVTYEYNGEAGMPTGETFHGIIADEAFDTFPEAVRRVRLKAAPDDVEVEYKAFDATPLTYALVNCVKELAARLAVLEGT